MAFATASPRRTGLLATLRQIPAETVVQVRIWSRVLGTAVGVAALAGAGQLGIAYGFGLLRFARDFPSGGLWSTQLTWVAWFAALAALAGAAAGTRAAGRHQLERQLGRRIILAAAAGLGALVVAPLTALPADSARLAPPVGTAPAVDAALAAWLGAVLGVLAAVAALSVRLVAVSVTLLVAGVWLLALISVAPSLAPTADLPEVRLGVLDLPALGGGGSAAAAVTAPVLALLVCGVVAVAARSRGLSPLQTAVATTAAPGLLALVYLVGSPGTGDRAVQASAYAGALIAVAAGLLASLLIGVVRLPAGRGVDPDTESTATNQLPPLAELASLPESPLRVEDQDEVAPLFPPPEYPPREPLEPVASPPAPGPAEPAEQSPVAEPAPEPAPSKPPAPEPAPSKPPAPDPPVSPASAAPATPDGPPPAPSRRRGRRRETEQEKHLDWISSLAGEAETDEPEQQGRRRLRRDRHEPDPPPAPPDPPSLHRPYVS